MRTIQRYQEESDTFKCPDCGKKVLKKTGYCLSCKKKVEEPKKEDSKKEELEKTQENLYESVLQAITEIDVDNATCEDFLRIGISAEEGAITLYNRIASAIKERKGENIVSKLFQHTAEEEKVHVGEFQRLLFDTDFEELLAHEEGSEEVDEVIDDFVDSIEAETEIEEPLDYENVYTVYEEIEIVDGDKKIILEKGDKIEVLDEMVDPDLQKVVDIADNAEGLFGLKAPLERVFGRGKVDFWGTSALVIKTRSGRKIIIASPQNVEADGTEIPVQGGNLLVGYDS